MFDSSWMKFISTTWMWIFTHAVDGLIVLVFNKELRSQKLLKMVSIKPKIFFTNKPSKVIPTIKITASS
ncbi:hypothetical protein L596_012577 [Steinernema carpocapsae]|uniref:7TM GPCR serpentine receptor class x (Srx) domain-containing protein n=1 Tax=Steinernema carpocapsae TaxID=34508 RepID=A0A4U5NXM2_STECR|nr:hypothetical protein L596_012577 [Steinernema carpocapsae]